MSYRTLLLLLSLGLAACDSDSNDSNDSSPISQPTEQLSQAKSAADVGRGPQVELNTAANLDLAPRTLAMANGQYQVRFQTRAPDAKTVTLAGEMNNWNGSATPMTRLSDGRWQVSLPLTAGSWMYKFVIDDQWQADANAPAFAPDGGQGKNSVVLVDKASALQIHQPTIAHGTLETLEFDSPALGSKSRFKLYLPPDYATSTKSYPLLILLHGYGVDLNQWQDDGLISTFADNMLAEGRIQPFIILLPDAGTSFYQPPYDELIVNELPAYLASHYRLKTGPANTAIAGVSMGGFGAIQLPMHHPNRFGFCASFSGAFTDLFFIDYDSRQQPKLGCHPKLYVGNLDLLDISGGYAESVNRTILDGNRNLQKQFIQYQQDLDYQESFGGHDWHYWNGQTPDLLERVSKFLHP